MRSSDIKIWRTDGSQDSDESGRLDAIRTAIQNVAASTVHETAANIVLLHDHKGNLIVFHFGKLHPVDEAMIRALWEGCCEPEESVSFVSLGRGDGRYEDAR